MQQDVMTGAVGGAPRMLLRLEGLGALAAAAFLFVQMQGPTTLGMGWPLLAILFFAPDLSMLAYLAGPRIGAVAYNAAHTYVAPLALAAAGIAFAASAAVAMALIWFAHIGFDRALGYGLKYPAGFGFTHLGRIGKDALKA